MDNKLFSVIVPIYNVGKYLSVCVDSILSQSFENIEIILVDDGSTDESARLCDDYQIRDSRVTVIHKENGGLVSARQAGVIKAKGDYIICVDGDDWIEQNYCEEMSKIVSNYNPDVICCGHYNSFPDKRVPVVKKRFQVGYYSKQDIETHILPYLIEDEFGYGFGLSMWAKAVKTELMKKYQMKVSKEINIGEDGACMGPCIFYSNSLFISYECLYNYRQNPESMTGRGKVFLWDGPEIRGKHLESVLDLAYGNVQDQINRGVVHALFNVVKSQFNRDDVSKKEIRRDIRIQLNRDYYVKAINESHFKGVKANVMRALLKYRLLYLVDFLNSH